jgi:uncharacterized protein (UPF0333 family)
MKSYKRLTNLNHRGFSHVEFFLIALVVFAVSGIGYYVYKNSSNGSKSSSAASEPIIAVASPLPNRLASGPLRQAFKNQISTRVAQEARNNTVNPACQGELGSRGARVDLVWVDNKNKPESDAISLGAKSRISQIAAGVDSIFIQSAKTQNLRYMVRWPRNDKCQIKARRLLLKQKDFDKFNSAIKSGPANKNPEKAVKILRRAGLNRSSRKYMVFSKVINNNVNMCGYDFMPFADDRPGQENKNNRLSSMQIINRQCWAGDAVEGPKKMDMYVQNAAFQLVHALGGPQKSAPHALKIDGSFLGIGAKKLKFVYNVTQYDDLLGYYGPFNHDETDVCETSATSLRAVMLDCANDDYFNALGDAVGNDNYLKTHWNIANSRFIEKVPNNTP